VIVSALNSGILTNGTNYRFPKIRKGRQALTCKFKKQNWIQCLLCFCTVKTSGQRSGITEPQQKFLSIEITSGGISDSRRFTHMNELLVALDS
jgi:hypothetical protein